MLVPAGRHHDAAADGEDRRRRVTKRTAGASRDRHLCAHGVNRSRSGAVTCSPSRCTLVRIMNSSFHLVGAAKLVAGCHVVLPGQAIGGPGVATRQVRGHHRIVVIRRTGTTQDGTGSRRRVHESAAEPRFARR